MSPSKLQSMMCPFGFMVVVLIVSFKEIPEKLYKNTKFLQNLSFSFTDINILKIFDYIFSNAHRFFCLQK